MSRTRDIIEEIAAVRKRRRFGSAIAELSSRLLSLERAFAEYDKANEELTRYFPVGIIACVEAYFRISIKDLVDAGEPFLSNAEKPAASLKLDYALLRAVHGKSITVGELVAHGVPLSRLDHIESTLSELLGAGFLDRLRTVTDRWRNEVQGQPAAPMLENVDAVFADVARMFELRHVICHEIASAYPITTQEVERCFRSCVSFLRAADELIAQIMHPGAPLTQTDMNIAAGESLDGARKRLVTALSRLRAGLDSQKIAALEESQHRWQTYCDAWTDCVAGERATGGTIWPLIYAGTAEAVVEHRIAEIEKFRRLSDSN